MNHDRPTLAATLPVVLTCLCAGARAQVSINVPIPINQGRAQMIDIRPGLGPNNIPLSSDPQHITAFGNRVLFVADWGVVRGKELWISDGTQGNTRRVKNLLPMLPGAQHERDDVQGHIAVLNGRAFFSARNDNLGIELWVTDGTETGTVPFADLNPGAADSNPQYLQRIGQQIFFGADDGTGVEPFVTDGVTAWKIRNIATGTNNQGQPLSSNPRYFAGFAPPGLPPKVVFQAETAAGRELWFTDGTAGNTRMLVDLMPGMVGNLPASGDPRFMTVVSPGLNGAQRVVFGAKIEIQTPTGPSVRDLPLVTDFTAQGTMPLFDPGWNVSALDFVRVGTSAYFSGFSNIHGWIVYSTDGTPGGTRPRYSSIGGTGTSRDMHLTQVGNRHLYLSSLVTIGTPVGRELVRINTLSPLGFSVFDLDPNGSGDPHNFFGGIPASGAPGDRRPFAVAGNKVFMAASVASVTNPLLRDTELFVVDNGATAHPEDWGCGRVSLFAEDPLIGTTMTFFGASQVPNPTNVVFLTPPSPMPVPLQGFQGCLFYGDMSFVVGLRITTGTPFFDTLTIPNRPSLIGAEWLSQALVVSTNPVTSFNLSNPVRIVLGNL